LTAQGHPRTRFKRAIERGNVLVAEATAREIGLRARLHTPALHRWARRATRCQHQRGPRPPYRRDDCRPKRPRGSTRVHHCRARRSNTDSTTSR